MEAITNSYNPWKGQKGHPVRSRTACLYCHGTEYVVRYLKRDSFLLFGKVSSQRIPEARQTEGDANPEMSACSCVVL